MKKFGQLTHTVSPQTMYVTGGKSANKTKSRENEREQPISAHRCWKWTKKVTKKNKTKTKYVHLRTNATNHKLFLADVRDSIVILKLSLMKKELTHFMTKHVLASWFWYLNLKERKIPLNLFAAWNAALTSSFFRFQFYYFFSFQPSRNSRHKIERPFIFLRSSLQFSIHQLYICMQIAMLLFVVDL